MVAGRKPTPLNLSPEDRRKLAAILADGRIEQRVARRARILVESDRGTSVGKIAEICDVNEATVWRICQKYRERGLTLQDKPRPGRPRRRATTGGHRMMTPIILLAHV